MSISLATRGIITEAEVAGGAGWTPEEKEQIRDALGIDGTKTKSVGGVIQKIKKLLEAILAVGC
ncbi:MAG: hypothetical protein J7K40_13775 [candidate division Zixibacteria bacterium]|nr:hypothetical protein [candidate division Zixibacteria bacterium]